MVFNFSTKDTPNHSSIWSYLWQEYKGIFPQYQTKAILLSFQRYQIRGDSSAPQVLSMGGPPSKVTSLSEITSAPTPKQLIWHRNVFIFHEYNQSLPIISFKLKALTQKNTKCFNDGQTSSSYFNPNLCINTFLP